MNTSALKYSISLKPALSSKAFHSDEVLKYIPSPYVKPILLKKFSLKICAQFFKLKASYFGISELKDNVKKSQVRIRIKPHSSTDGAHSFTCALKLNLLKSDADLTDDEFLVKIQQYLEGT